MGKQPKFDYLDCREKRRTDGRTDCDCCTDCKRQLGSDKVGLPGGGGGEGNGNSGVGVVSRAASCSVITLLSQLRQGDRVQCRQGD